VYETRRVFVSYGEVSEANVLVNLYLSDSLSILRLRSETVDYLNDQLKNKFYSAKISQKLNI
jgi:hypothetical protein